MAVFDKGSQKRRRCSSEHLDEVRDRWMAGCRQRLLTRDSRCSPTMGTMLTCASVSRAAERRLLLGPGLGGLDGPR